MVELPGIDVLKWPCVAWTSRFGQQALLKSMMLSTWGRHYDDLVNFAMFTATMHPLTGFAKDAIRHLIIAHLRLHVSYIPTDLNPADAPSRFGH